MFAQRLVEFGVGPALGWRSGGLDEVEHGVRVGRLMEFAVVVVRVAAV
jgi:hypothetical protein